MHYGYQPRCSDKCCVLSWSDHLVACRPAMMSCDTGGYLRYLGYAVSHWWRRLVVLPVHIDTTVLRTTVKNLGLPYYLYSIWESKLRVQYFVLLRYYIAYTLIVRMYCSAMYLVRVLKYHGHHNLTSNPEHSILFTLYTARNPNPVIL